MGALKKMTQCGSISMLFAVLIVLFGVSSSALSTFGKSNTNQQAAATTRAPAKTKDCTNNADCLTIQNTSCVPAADGRLQCLCGDFETPINGYCQAKFKGHRHVCQHTDQCDIGMVCTTENITRTTLVTSKTFMTSSMLNNTNAQKLCLCDKENGYVEDEHDYRRCSSAVALMLSIPLLLIAIGSSIAKKPFSYY